MARPLIVAPPWLQKARFVSRADAQFLYDECHVQRVYEQGRVTLRRAAPHSNVAVLDVGANVGMFSTRAAEALGPGGLVIAAEPLPTTYAALEHNVAVHRDFCAEAGTPCAPVIAVNAGVGDGSTDACDFIFYPRAAGWGTMASLESPDTIFADMDAVVDNFLDDESNTALNPLQRMMGGTLRRVAPVLYRAVTRMAVQRMLAGREIQRCKMTTVSALIDDNNVRDVALLKIDVERAEVGVLKGVEARHWPTIGAVSAEAHAENLDEVVAILRGAGGFDKVTVQQTPDLVGTSIHMVFATRGEGSSGDALPAAE